MTQEMTTIQQVIIALLSMLSDEGRMEVLDGYRRHHCMGCGTDRLPCHCANDE